MADWTPIPGPNSQRRRRRRADWVRLHPSGLIVLSVDVVQQLGDTGHVMPLMNGRRDLIGLRGTRPAPRSSALKLTNHSGGSTSISAWNILSTAGKTRPEKPLDLPHHWDGDVLVIDLSGLTDAPGGQ